MIQFWEKTSNKQTDKHESIYRTFPFGPSCNKNVILCIWSLQYVLFGHVQLMFPLKYNQDRILPYTVFPNNMHCRSRLHSTLTPGSPNSFELPPLRREMVRMYVMNTQHFFREWKDHLIREFPKGHHICFHLLHKQFLIAMNLQDNLIREFPTGIAFDS